VGRPSKSPGWGDLRSRPPPPPPPPPPPTTVPGPFCSAPSSPPRLHCAAISRCRRYRPFHVPPSAPHVPYPAVARRGRARLSRHAATAAAAAVSRATPSPRRRGGQRPACSVPTPWRWRPHSMVAAVGHSLDPPPPALPWTTPCHPLLPPPDEGSGRLPPRPLRATPPNTPRPPLAAWPGDRAPKPRHRRAAPPYPRPRWGPPGASQGGARVSSATPPSPPPCPPEAPTHMRAWRAVSESRYPAIPPGAPVGAPPADAGTYAVSPPAAVAAPLQPPCAAALPPPASAPAATSGPP